MPNTEDKPNTEQTRRALEHIAHMASSLRRLCWQIEGGGDEDGEIAVAAANLAAKIGWTADRCLNFDVQDSDSWLMSPVWNQIADKVKAEQEVTD